MIKKLIIFLWGYAIANIITGGLKASNAYPHYTEKR